MFHRALQLVFIKWTGQQALLLLRVHYKAREQFKSPDASKVHLTLPQSPDMPDPGHLTDYWVPYLGLAGLTQRFTTTFHKSFQFA